MHNASAPQCCCCCAENLGALLIQRFDHPPGSVRGGSRYQYRFGHELNVRFTVSYMSAPQDGNCTFCWEEWVDTLAPGAAAAPVATYNAWNPNHINLPHNFPNVTRSRPDKCPSGRLDSDDADMPGVLFSLGGPGSPLLARQVWRAYIRVTLFSSSGCNCKQQSIVRTYGQQLTWENNRPDWSPTASWLIVNPTLPAGTPACDSSESGRAVVRPYP